MYNINIKIATRAPSSKRSPPFSHQPPLKIKVLSSPPFLKIW